jgi:cysteine-rich repeat protein
MRSIRNLGSLFLCVLCTPLALGAAACGDDASSGGSNTGGSNTGGAGGTAGGDTGGMPPVVAPASSGTMMTPTLIGNPCSSDDECGDLVCISELNSGFPAGMCSIGCMDDSECEGEVCNLVGGGFCVDACGSDTCRDGYSCVDVGGVEGCVPACTNSAQCTVETAECKLEEGDPQLGLCISPELCMDGGDNDLDQLPDCTDSDCLTDTMCAAEIAETCTMAAVALQPQPGDTGDGSSLFAGSCPFVTGLGSEQIFTFTTPARGQLHLEADPTDGDLALYVRSGCADPTTQAACSDNNQDGAATEIVDIGAQGGETWTIFVDAYQPGTEGAFNLTATFTPAVCGDGNVTLPETCDDTNVMDDDGCSALCEVELDFFCNAATVINTGTTMGNTSSGTTLFEAPVDGGDCSFGAGTAGNESLYVYTPATTGMLTIELAPTGDVDMGVYARTDCLDGATQVGCSDVNFQGNQDESLTIPVTAQVPVTIFVDAYQSAGGAFALTLTQN